MSVFDITGKFLSDEEIIVGNLDFKDIKLYINIPEWIDERNIYDVNTKEVKATIKPKKFGGLSYSIIDFDSEFAKIKTVNFGESLIKITNCTPLSNYPYYESGCYE